MTEYIERAINIIQNKEALVFCGGGVLGIAECGALIALEELGLDLTKIKSVSGSSAGSILAAIVAAKGTTEYMKEKLNTMDFNKLKDRDCFLRSLWQLIKKYGINETKSLKKELSQFMLDLTGNPNITMAELYDLTGITLTTTYLSMVYGTTLYSNYANNPNIKIIDAVTRSSSIPVFYEAEMDVNDTFLDGGTVNNYPINIPKEQGIEPNKILGLKLISSSEVNYVDNGGSETMMKMEKPKNAIEHFTRVINIMRDQALRLHVDKNDWVISIKINVGNLSSTDFGLSQEKKDWLFEQGKNAVYDYVDELAELLEDGRYPY